MIVVSRFVALVAPAVLVLAPLASTAADTPPVDGFRAKVAKWVEARKIRSEESADWLVERELLRGSRDLLKDQKAALEAEVPALEESNSAADDERRDLLLERAELTRVANALEERIRSLEQSLLALVPQLPAPLVKTLEPLLVQIPRNDAAARGNLEQRLIAVLGILGQTQKFNSTATFVGETRAVRSDSDEKVSVRTLYWGLGRAVYVDARGDVAGTGAPGPDGWTFDAQPDMAADASLLLDIYEGNVDRIEFVEVPVEIVPNEILPNASPSSGESTQ